VVEIRVYLAGCCQHCSETFSVIKYGGIDVARVVNRQPVTAEARVRSQASSCKVCYGHWLWDSCFSYYLGFSHVSINPLILDAHSFIYQRRYISATDNIFK
jgi:hypothetical protein